MANIVDKLQDDVNKALNAHNFLQDPIFKEAIQSLEHYLTAEELRADPDDTEKCRRLVITRQNLADILRQFDIFIKNGNAAKYKMESLEKERLAKKVKRVFQR